MKISARNQLQGKITKIIHGLVNCEVVVDVDGMDIKSVITDNSAKDMELKVGDTVIALIKSSQIIISKDQLHQISARNLLKTKVKDIVNGQVNCQLKLRLGENIITSTITNDAYNELQISNGDTVYALFKSSSVILIKE